MSNQADLHTKISKYVNRDDLDDIISSIQKYARSRIGKDLRHWRLIVTDTILLLSGQNTITLPDEWIETISLKFVDKQPLYLVSRETLLEDRLHGDNINDPREYSFFGNNIEFYPTLTSDRFYEHVYYKLPDVLSNDTATDSNDWLYNNHGEIYVYACLIEVEGYLKNYQKVTHWSRLYQECMDKLNEENRMANESGGTRFLRIRGMSL